MDDKTGMLNEIVYRLKQSLLTFSIDEVGRLELSESLKRFIREIVQVSKTEGVVPPNSRSLQELESLGVREIEEISTAVEVVIHSRDQRGRPQYVTNQFNFFPTPPQQNTFPNTFGLPKVFGQFTGREDEFHKLKNNLGKAEAITQKISGTGGVGKSQLANYFAHKMLQEGRYQWVIWLSGGLDEKAAQSAVQSQLRLLGMEFGFDVKQIQDKALYRAIYQRLFEKGRGLCIFDDMPNYDVMALYMPENYGPFKADVLITTRNSNYFGPDVKEISLDVFSLMDAKQYIQKILKERISEGEAEDLAITLGRYPLALSQATAYIANNRECTVSEYCHRYSSLVEARKNYLARKVVGDPYEQERRERERPFESTMIAVIEMSLKQIERTCETREGYEQVMSILMAVAYVAAESAIPRGVFKGWLPEDRGEIMLTTALEILRSFSLVEEAKKGVGYQIHQVVQEVLKLAEPHENSLNKLLRWKKVIKDYLKSVLSSRVSANEIKYLELKPHALVLAEQLSREARTEDILEAEATLYGFIGEACEIQGESKEGKYYYGYAESCHRQRPVSVSQREDRADALLGLGCAMLNVGDPQEAKEKIHEALTIMKEVKGEGHVSVGKYLLCLGEALLKCEDLVGAKEKLMAALPILETARNENALSVARCLSNLGLLVVYENPQWAKEKLEASLAIFQAEYGERSATVASCMTNLGFAMLNCGDPQGAREKMESALLILKDRYGENHGLVGQCLFNLGGAKRKCGDASGGKESYEAALVILKANYGEEHPEVARCLASLGETVIMEGDALKAQGMLEKALNIFIKVYGADNRVTQSCRKTYEKISAVVSALVTIQTNLLKGSSSSLTGQLFPLAERCFERGLIIEAKAILEKIFLEGLFAEGLLLQARCQLLCGEYNAAYESASMCQELPSSKNGEVEKLLVDIKKGRQEASLWATQVSAIRSRAKLTISDQINLVMNLRYLKRYDEALSVIENIISQKPNSVLLATVHLYQSQCYYSLQRFEDALLSVNKSLQLKENSHAVELKRKIDLAIDDSPMLKRVMEQLLPSSATSVIAMK